MPTLSITEAAPRLEDLLDDVRLTGERVVISADGSPVAALVRLRDLYALEETVEILSSLEALQRLDRGDTAFQTGDYIMGAELKQLDPTGRWTGVAVDAKDRWDLMVSAPARRSLEKVDGRLSDFVLGFIFEKLRVDPQHVGIELRGRLSRRFAARVETETVIYRLDSVKHAVRIIEVLHRGGLVGHSQGNGHL